MHPSVHARTHTHTSPSRVQVGAGKTRQLTQALGGDRGCSISRLWVYMTHLTWERKRGLNSAMLVGEGRVGNQGVGGHLAETVGGPEDKQGQSVPRASVHRYLVIVYC